MPGLSQVPNLVVTVQRRPRVPLPDATRRSRLPSARTQLLDESLFLGALKREQRRADRFEEPFALMRITVPDSLQAESRWPSVVEALFARTRGTDIVGWYQQGTVIGLIFDLAQDAHEAATRLATTVQAELARGLATAAAGCSIRLDIYSPRALSPATRSLEGDGRPARAGDLVRRAAKRGVDIAGSAVLLTLLSPVLLALAALVKWTSRGPVFYRQERVGQYAAPFTMLKFRTMRADAGHEIHQQYVSQFIQAKPDTQVPATATFKIVNDPRVTRLGSFLRRSSLDELPQFWNVLKGEMSLVGPRPPLSYEVNCYKAWHRRRLHEAKPGITGLWQVTGRSRTTFDEMVRLDLRYARTHSVWADLKILLATPRAVLSGKGAH